MKKVLLLCSLVLCGIAISHESSILDDEKIFKSLKVEPVIIKHPTDGYEMISKSVPGFIDCRLSTYENGVQGYQCSFGTHDGFSMADVAYDFIDAEEIPLKTDDRGRWFQKKIGGLICTKVFLNKREETGYQLSKCEITLSFGMLK